MRYYLDTEFIERGYEKVELISIGIVADDGREFYAVASDGWEMSHVNPWVLQNVMPYLGGPWMRRIDIAFEIRRMMESDSELMPSSSSPEVYGYYADYDWVLFCQLFGSMMQLPKGFPRFCRDVKQIAVEMGNPQLPKQESGEHNALADARHIRTMHRFLEGLK